MHSNNYTKLLSSNPLRVAPQGIDLSTLNGRWRAIFLLLSSPSLFFFVRVIHEKDIIMFNLGDRNIWRGAGEPGDDDDRADHFSPRPRDDQPYRPRHSLSFSTDGFSLYRFPCPKSLMILDESMRAHVVPLGVPQGSSENSVGLGGLILSLSSQSADALCQRTQTNRPRPCAPII